MDERDTQIPSRLAVDVLVESEEMFRLRPRRAAGEEGEADEGGETAARFVKRRHLVVWECDLPCEGRDGEGVGEESEVWRWRVRNMNGVLAERGVW